MFDFVNGLYYIPDFLFWYNIVLIKYRPNVEQNFYRIFG